MKNKPVPNDLTALKQTTWRYGGLRLIITWVLSLMKICTGMRMLILSVLHWWLIQRTLHTAPLKCKSTANKALVRHWLEYACLQLGAPIQTKTLVSSKRSRITLHASSTRSQDDCPGRHWRRWRRASTSPVATSVTALKKDLNWPTLQKRRNTSGLIMWYKVHFGLVAINFPPVVLTAIHCGSQQSYFPPTRPLLTMH